MWSSQQQQLFRVLLSIIYQTGLQPDQWLTRVCGSLSRLLHLSQGMGVIGYFATLYPGSPIEDTGWASEPGVDLAPFINGFRTYQEVVDPHVQMVKHSDTVCGYASEVMPYFLRNEQKVLDQIFPARGVRDVFGSNALGPDRDGVFLVSFVAPGQQPTIAASDRALMRELAFHISVAGHMVRRPNEMSSAEAFADFQQKTMQTFVPGTVLQGFHDLGRLSIEQVAITTDEQDPSPHRLTEDAAYRLYDHLEQGRLIVHHRFENAGAVYWVVQRPIPFLQPSVPFSHEEEALFVAFATQGSLKQAVDCLPARRSLGHGYQLLQSIAAKLCFPESKPEDLLPIAKVWLGSIADQPPLASSFRKQKRVAKPHGLRATVCFIRSEPYYVLRTLEDPKRLFEDNPPLPRSALKLVSDALAGKTPAEMAQSHDLQLSTVLRRLATARRLGLLSTTPK